MKKLLKKWMVYTLLSVLALPTWAGLGYATASKAEAAVGDPFLATYTLDNPTISPNYPNGDGVLDVATIDIIFSEKVHASFDIVDSDGKVVRNFYGPADVTNPTSFPKIWNGTKDDMTTPVPDGVYTLKIDYKRFGVEGAVDITDTSKTITIDTVAPLTPQAIVTYPVNSSNQKSVSISGSAEANTALLYAIVDIDKKSVETPQDQLDLTDQNGNFMISGIDVSGLKDGALGVGLQSFDEAGNGSVIAVGGTFKDTVSPVITMTGSDVTIGQYEYYKDASAVASDGETDLTKNIVATNSVDTDVAGIYTVKYDVTDAAGNSAVEITRNVTVVAATVMDLSTDSKIAVIPAGAIVGTAVTVPATVTDASLDLSALLNVAGTDPQSATVTKQITINSTLSDNSTMSVVLPGAPLTITGPLSWDGKISLPSIAVTGTVSPTVTAGTAAANVERIEIGLATSSLTFDQPVKLVFFGAYSKKVGFTSGTVFSEITTLCDNADAPTNFTVDPALKECKIVSADDKDLIVWTKHFTQFVTYSEAIVTPEIISLKNVQKNNGNFIEVAYQNTGAILYEISIDGVVASPVSTVSNVALVKVNTAGKHAVRVRSLVGGVYSAYSAVKSVTVASLPVVEAATTTTTTTTTTTVVAPSVAPVKARAAAPVEPKVETPVAQPNVIKAATPISTDEKENTNWTPWIVLFILILLAGAATGGYFYWFVGKEEVEKAPIKEELPKKVVEKKVTKSTPAKNSKSKKNKRW